MTMTSEGRKSMHSPMDIPLIPYVVSQSPNGERSYDIYSRLLEDRIVFVGEPITRDSANLVVAQLLYLESTSPGEPISMYINSPGGEVYAGLGILDTMRFISSPVHTTCVGMAASMASILLAAGEKKHRHILPNSIVMIHQPSSGVQGQQTEIQIIADETRRIRNKINELLSDFTGKPLDQVNADTERDNYLTAEQAMEYGLVDSIIRSKIAEGGADVP